MIMITMKIKSNSATAYGRGTASSIFAVAADGAGRIFSRR